MQFEATHLPATDTTIIFFSTGLELMSFQLSYLLKRKKGQEKRRKEKEKKNDKEKKKKEKKEKKKKRKRKILRKR